MIICRVSCFSNQIDKDMVEKLIDKLNKSTLEDYEISDKISRDTISIVPSKNPIVYIPMDLEYSQYNIDDFVRSISFSTRSNTILDRNIYKMTFSTSFTLDNVFKLVKYIIDEEEFCTIVVNED